MAICVKHIQEPAPLISSERRALGAQGLSRVVARMLAKRRDDRHASYAAIVADLELVLGRPPSPPPGRRSNLVPLPTRFVGRAAELTDLAARFEDGDRLVSILGPWGHGQDPARS